MRHPPTGGERLSATERTDTLRGRRSDSRSNALWGRRGESRANALWRRAGKRNALLLAVLALLVTPLGANANNARTNGHSTVVAADVLARAKADPNAKIHVIIQSSGGAAAAERAFRSADASDPTVPGMLARRFDFVGAVAVELQA